MIKKTRESRLSAGNKSLDGFLRHYPYGGRLYHYLGTTFLHCHAQLLGVGGSTDSDFGLSKLTGVTGPYIDLMIILKGVLHEQQLLT